MPTLKLDLVAGVPINLKDAPISLGDGDDFTIQNQGSYPVYYTEQPTQPADLSIVASFTIPPMRLGYPWATGTVGVLDMYVWTLYEGVTITVNAN